MSSKGSDLNLGDKLETKLQRVVEETGHSRSDMNQMLDEKYEEYKDHQVSSMGDEQIKKMAVHSVTNKALNINTSGTDYEEVPILTLGYEYRQSEYFFTDGDAIVALGVVTPENDPSGLGTFIIDGGHGLDLEYVGELFEPLNTIVGDIERRQVGTGSDEPTFKKGGYPTYALESGQDTTFEEKDNFEGLPTDREEKREIINDTFLQDGKDVVTLQNYAEHVSVQNDSGYPLQFGIDVKRFRGEIVDVFTKVDSDTRFGTMTLTDETVFDESDIPDELVVEQMRSPGLQVFMDPLLLQCAEGSVVDVYGHVGQDDEGKFRMNGFGMIPIVEYERTTDTIEHDEVEQETI